MRKDTEHTEGITNREGFLKQVQEIAAIGGWEFDCRADVVRWTDELYRIHSIEPGSVQTLTEALAYYHPQDRPTVSSALDKLLADKAPYDIEARIQRPDGETRWVRTRGEPWYEDGTFRGAHGSLQDITDQKERQQDLELFRAAVEQAGHGVVITDHTGTIEYANPAYVEDTGYEREELLEANPRLSKSGKHDETFYDQLWETIIAGDVWQTEQLINRRKSGELYHVDQTIAPITTDDEISHFVGIESEITDLRLREQRLDVLCRILRHNVRNSMNVIRGYLSVLESEIEADQQPTIETITDRIDQLVSISDKVSTLQSLFEEPLDDTHCAVDELVEQLTEKFDAAYPDATVTASVPTAETAVRCDDRITIAISEAIENAIVHNDNAEPTVTVHVCPPAETTGRVTVRVLDNGPGIPTQDRKAIEIGEETAITHASSIGLWVIYWTVKTFGGEVSIRDNEPTGSIVELAFPAVDQPPEQA